MSILIAFHLVRKTGGYSCYEIGEGLPVRINVEAFSPDDKATILLDFDILWCWTFPGQLLEQAHKLSWIQTVSAGVDHFLESDLFTDRIMLTQAKGFHGVPMAEYVFGALLGHVRGLFSNVLANRDRQMKRKKPLLLRGKTMGIIGPGSIGQEIARIARCFGMRTIGLRRSKGLGVPFFDDIFTFVDRQEFCRKLHYLVIAAPLTHDTRGMVNHDFLSMLKPGTVLVNVGRGEIIVEQDLMGALNSGQLSQAIIDVWTGDNPSPVLFSAENLLITPHFSGLFKEYADCAARIFCDNLIRFISGEPLLFQVDRSRGY